jgi:sugar phosphate isomerase/epimerase
MKLGMCMASLLDRDWPSALDATLALGVTSVEVMGGGHVPRRHLDPVRALADAAARSALTRPIAERGMELAAIGCYGNFLDPEPDARRVAQEDLRAAIQLAAELGVGRVTSNAGCPAGAPGDRAPNWIAQSLFPSRWDEAYAWQWEACVLPFWAEIGQLAAEHGVDVCLEPMGGDVVYNLGTFRRLREHAGDRILCHVDPSHLWWQGIDVLEFVAAVRGQIGFAHVKDVTINPAALRVEGWLTSCAYDDWDQRSWSMRAIGNGHGEPFWREYLIALRRAGYDDCVAVEFQEPYMTVEDGLRLSVDTMQATMPRDPAPRGNWFAMYES